MSAKLGALTYDMDDVMNQNSLDADTIDQLRSRLNEELAEARGAIDQSTSSLASFIASRRGIEVDDEHDPEGSTLAMQFSETSALLDNSRHHLDQVIAALGKIDGSGYGSCELCAQPIPLARLKARPAAAHCVPCAEVARV